jgi:hypothetical protein
VCIRADKLPCPPRIGLLPQDIFTRLLDAARALRDLYRTLQIPGANRLRDAHAALDSVVCSANDMKESEDTLSVHLHLDLELASTEANGKKVTPPGPRASISKPEEYATAECIQIP